jgi:death-on-curing protein
VFAAHEIAILIGGLDGVRELTVIESGIARPYVGFRRRIWEKAAALLQSIAQNHGFIDGNKRTALLVLNVFLERSGYRLTPLEGENLSDAAETVVLGLVEHRIDLEALTSWFRQRLAKA